MLCCCYPFPLLCTPCRPQELRQLLSTFLEGQRFNSGLGPEARVRAARWLFYSHLTRQQDHAPGRRLGDQGLGGWEATGGFLCTPQTCIPRCSPIQCHAVQFWSISCLFVLSTHAAPGQPMPSPRHHMPSLAPMCPCAPMRPCAHASMCPCAHADPQVYSDALEAVVALCAELALGGPACREAAQHLLTQVMPQGERCSSWTMLAILSAQ